MDKLLERAPDWQPKTPRDEKAKTRATERENELIEQLAQMQAGIEYARLRKEAAKELGVSGGDIDDEVAARREANVAPIYGHWIVEPWPDPVDGDSLLRDIIVRFRRHVVFCSPNDDPLAIALWIVLGWVHEECAIHSPILVITSAEPESGKTTTLDLLAFLMPRCIATVEISDAALYRSIKRWQPSFAIDEFDTVLASDDKKQLRSVINSGHTRAQTVIRCVTDDQIPEPFSTFCPKALGMVGRKLPAATASRCIFIEQRRRTSSEPIERFEFKDDSELTDLRRRLFRWSLDNADALRGAKPTMPDGFDNRRADNWRLQFAIADLAGDEWGDKARAAATKLDRASDIASISVRVLADIKRIFDEGKYDCMLSAVLVAKLKEDEEAPWAEWNHGKGLTQNSLAVLLGGGGGRGRGKRGGFGIHTETVHPPGCDHGRGYKRERFEDAWQRYLPTHTPSQGDE